MPLTNSGNTSCFHSGSNLLRFIALKKKLHSPFTKLVIVFQLAEASLVV
jgi:hypothetical protein